MKKLLLTVVLLLMLTACGNAADSETSAVSDVKPEYIEVTAIGADGIYERQDEKISEVDELFYGFDTRTYPRDEYKDQINELTLYIAEKVIFHDSVLEKFNNAQSDSEINAENYLLNSYLLLDYAQAMIKLKMIKLSYMNMEYADPSYRQDNVRIRTESNQASTLDRVVSAHAEMEDLFPEYLELAVNAKDVINEGYFPMGSVHNAVYEATEVMRQYNDFGYPPIIE